MSSYPLFNAGKKRGQAQIESSAEEDGEDEDDDAAPFSHARPDDGRADQDDDGDEEGEEEGFIVEDGDQAVELPAEFSMNTYQDLLHHFKIVCQLFVHMAVHDADERGEAATKLQSSGQSREFIPNVPF